MSARPPTSSPPSLRARLAGLGRRLLTPAGRLLARLDGPLGRFERAAGLAWPYLERYGSLALARLHAGLGWLLVRLGRGAVRAVGPLPWAARLGPLYGLLAGLGVWFGLEGQALLESFWPLTEAQWAYLQREGYLADVRTWQWMMLGTGLFCLLCVPLTLWRHRLTARLLAVGGAAWLTLWGWAGLFALRVPGALFAQDVDGFDKGLRNSFWVGTGTRWFLLGLLPLLALFVLVLRRLREAYGVPSRRQPLGDRLLASLRSGGPDPRFRTSWYWSLLVFFLVFAWPFLMRGCGMEEAYAIPAGAGQPVVEFVMQKPPKEKPKKKWILAENSPFIFERIDIDESKVIEQVDRMTENTYQAQSLKGKLGTKGKGAGWPGGMPGKVRFIRLKYSGGDWDQDMGKGADYNFLIQFAKMTGFEIARDTEAIAINRLRRFPEDRAPPFVFITGKGNIRVSAEEIKTLRWYCLEEGGMLFADNGGGGFNRNFRRLLRQVFPQKRLIDIANDDPIYRTPFLFPNGAPPMWHHSGYRALGVKHEGRWVVFYHQGDLNDAWKDGHSGTSEQKAQQAYQMGVNVLYYAFTRYLEQHRPE
jgi:hypothetical protein